MQSRVFPRSSASRARLLRFFSVLIIASLVFLPTGALAASPSDKKSGGFLTSQPSMLTPVMSGVTVKPILTVGDNLPSGYQFEALPDGIALRKHKGAIEVFVNHETSKVPFPYNSASPTAANSENDFDNSQVSLLVLNKKTAGVLNGSFLVPSSLGYQRFCSNFLATEKHGFEDDILFTNEEGIDYVFRQENSWPPAIGDTNERQIGVVIAVDVETGAQHPIFGMGRFNHENSVALPWGDDDDGEHHDDDEDDRPVVVISGDDTFTSGPLTGVAFPAGVTTPAQSQVYSYIAPSADALLNDEGDLWAFVSDTPGVKNYYDVLPGSGAVVTGHFIQVPKVIATGINPNTGGELKSSDMAGLGFGPYPAPPTNGSWQRDLRNTTFGVDGPQWVLEYWSNINNVFQFVRVEDIAYDKRPGMDNILYIVDSGRGRTVAQSLDTPNFKSTNGRVWQMVLDPNDPTIVTSLSVFVEGDDNPVQTLNEVHQPDNIETTKKGLLLTEDPGSSQQFAVTSTDPNRTTARLWFVPFSGAPQVVASVDQSADGGVTDVDGRAPGSLGAWETTGIVDASDAFGKGYFLINVQAHSLWVERAEGDDNFAPVGPDFTYKREGGQMLLIYIPGL